MKSIISSIIALIKSLFTKNNTASEHTCALSTYTRDGKNLVKMYVDGKFFGTFDADNQQHMIGYWMDQFAGNNWEF